MPKFVKLGSEEAPVAETMELNCGVILELRPYDPSWDFIADRAAALKLRENDSTDPDQWEALRYLELAKLSISGWPNVLGPDDKPLPCTPENIEAYLFRRVRGALEDFSLRWRMRGRAQQIEGEASAPSSNGTTDEGAPTALAA